MQVVENDIIKYWIDDGILFSEYKKPVNITLNDAKAVILLRHQISNNKNQYWCYDIAFLKSYSKETRDYADVHGQDMLYATAVIVNSHITMFLFNSFIKLKKPVIPTHVFKNKEKAVAWLKEMKKKNENS